MTIQITTDHPSLADLVRQLGAEALRGADRDQLRMVEIAMRDSADAIARELRVELCLNDDWADK
ncbi:hypothetical protein ABIF65_001166 [Bradyrhizobium japonicum]|uniref:hypothetical protein n=1 Tax=Bradyrhizobium TaxID=374 RepID=UPI0004042F7E|nr:MULTISPECIES: hypothetical protein [Bradyrhizobium]MBR0884639.1 hypothetical protein [Bradyrhizobium liaoningense]MBR0998316.1 hypothetical protein [Bradyrhizobium liaoningense]MBR1071290.1 hypothetical protein [Bradyrhizobium liaoningense]MCP1739699.1 hypothetical protein [Bradyrhizobium japonicum]MCP1777884.1 hypothetical protein [Bradyrhizobium japonicum]